MVTARPLARQPPGPMGDTSLVAQAAWLFLVPGMHLALCGHRSRPVRVKSALISLAVIMTITLAALRFLLTPCCCNGTDAVQPTCTALLATLGLTALGPLLDWSIRLEWRGCLQEAVDEQERGLIFSGCGVMRCGGAESSREGARRN